ncbi:RNA-guided endonuclease InsQ/TnpB family protein [Caryophanon tenue]|uniref:Transposase n=1 Tax=Caryophanon tenue TaxID=33978 RepID=A0A1C0YJX1_9BACL|nr:RNA-guided endonuclease TnpB family protein [Caryophanon tenue]OCS87441.1 transposase [Caryophanon tenue]
MIKAIKIRLFPTNEQEILMRKSCGIARFAYNWGLARWEEMYQQGLVPTKGAIKKEFNQTVKRLDEFKWLYEVSAQVTAQAFEDLNQAYQYFFKGIQQKPQFKTKKRARKSFYVRYDALKFKDSTVNIEKIGKVKYKTNYKIPKLNKYANPRCSFDGKYWYLAFGFEQDENKVMLDKSLHVGIDLGIKYLAVVNCLEEPIENINKTAEMKRLKKKLIRLQRQVSRKYEMNKCEGSFVKTKNILKTEQQIKLVYRRLTNIRTNHIHQATKAIIKLKPACVVMEHLNIRGMLKNKYLAGAIQEQKLYEFIRQMKYKCTFDGIEFIQADRFYSSSKICSNCGVKKQKLKLDERIFTCDICGISIDRDKNASINLANYKLRLN